MTDTASTPVVFDPYDYRFHDDPYPTYARLRAEEPVYENPDIGFWALSRYSDVVAGLRDAAHLSSANGVSLDPAAWGPHAHYTMSFLALDDPRHIRMRSLVSKGFTPRRVRELEGRVLELTTEYLDAALDKGEFDYIGEFAGKLPMDVISELVGVPVADRDRLRRLADLVMHREEGVLDVPPTAVESALELGRYYAEMVKARRANRTEDLTSALLDADLDGDRLSDQEIIGFLFLMVVAGNETTTKLLGNAVYWAWRNPAQLATVLADPGRVPDWIEETLRYDTSSQIIARTVVGDREYHGRTVPDGARMLLLLGSANRDGDAFSGGDEYDLDRDRSTPIASFGSGAHFCLGAHLARLEARVALTELVHRVSGYEIDEPNAVRVHSTNVRGFANLPLRAHTR